MRFSDPFPETAENAVAFATGNFRKTAQIGIFNRMKIALSQDISPPRCINMHRGIKSWGQLDKHVPCRRNRNTHSGLML